MPFPTVKSDPWGRARPRPRRRPHIWPGAFWDRLCKQAQEDYQGREQPPRYISPACLRLISEMNRLLAPPG